MFPTLSLGILPWQTIAQAEGSPVALLATHIPYIGFLAGKAAALLGATIILLSANTALRGVSRLTFSMSELKIAGDWFNKIDPTFGTPVRAILFFSLVAAVEVLLSFIAGPQAMEGMANLYAFGVTLAYLLSLISLVRLRLKDPYTPRPYKMPFNIRLREIEIPLLAILGIFTTSALLVLVLWTHPLGRIAGPGWILLWTFYYFWYRKREGAPLTGNLKRNWEADQISILTSAEEFDLLEQYKSALADRG